ncbi:hypothetical protein CVT24_011883 [Panaeolus cyanescens]|uniref:Dyp-type peroxidase n=1 Tax=Panaeolus cyanescens TaxID=181874 RepID=A0A409YNW3_9AGAR|nr:hypothetical protein CVT24_011883 [Panaeolus cyanescens]
MTSTGPAVDKLDLKNIQGDILSGLPKKTEFYYFFNITDGPEFRKDLCDLVPLITTVDQVLKDRKRIDDHKKQKLPGLVPLTGVNISFSHLGFVKLKINDDTLSANPASRTDAFTVGQKKDAVTTLGDPARPDGQPDWDDSFLKNEIHGLFIISGESIESIEKKKREVNKIFGVGSEKASIKEIKTIKGDVRPGDLHAHEHFGFLDGISNPVIKGFDKDVNPGPPVVDPGVIVTGHTGDEAKDRRQDWAKDGSFLAFRWLDQLVPEFDKYLVDNALKEDGNGQTLTPEQGAELLGARMVGRWKSGAPIDLVPFKDDPQLAKDPKRNNNFHYADEINSQLRCPFAAHVRKTNPRNDLEGRPNGVSIPVAPNRIMRRGIQFGKEVTKEEKESATTKLPRGLLFACYQTNLEKGFQFIQQSKVSFGHADSRTSKAHDNHIRLDPIVGQGNRVMSGLDPLDPKKELSMPAFVVPRGGEYFFTPSLKGLKNTIAVAA